MVGCRQAGRQISGHMDGQTNKWKGVAMVWWSAQWIAAREVCGSNPAPGSKNLLIYFSALIVIRDPHSQTV